MSNKVVFDAEVLVLGVVDHSNLAVPLAPQHLGFPFELHEQRVYLAVFDHLQRDMTGHPVPTRERVLRIDRVEGNFNALHGRRHAAEMTNSLRLTG